MGRAGCAHRHESPQALKCLRERAADNPRRQVSRARACVCVCVCEKVAHAPLARPGAHAARRRRSKAKPGRSRPRHLLRRDASAAMMSRMAVRMLHSRRKFADTSRGASVSLFGGGSFAPPPSQWPRPGPPARAHTQ